MKKYIKIYKIFFKYWKLLLKMNYQTVCRLLTINSYYSSKKFEKDPLIYINFPPTPKSCLQPLQFKRMEWVIQNDPTILWIWRQELYIMVQVKIMLLGKKFGFFFFNPHILSFFFFFCFFLRSEYINLIKILLVLIWVITYITFFFFFFFNH